MKRAKPGDEVGRGIWIAPWMGPNGELVLLAITSTKRLAAPPFTIPAGADRVEASVRLLDVLDEVDPDVRLTLKVI